MFWIKAPVKRLTNSLNGKWTYDFVFTGRNEKQLHGVCVRMQLRPEGVSILPQFVLNLADIKTALCFHRTSIGYVGPLTSVREMLRVHTEWFKARCVVAKNGR